jgi:CRP-like cAMP-binding protein
MEQHRLSLSEAADEDFLLASAPIGPKPGGIRCGLPLGRALICGSPKHREDLAPDIEVIAGGAHTRDVWFVRTGILRLQRHSYDGRRQILSLFLPGEIVGFEEEFRDGANIETAAHSRVCRIDSRRFGQMVDRNKALRTELFRQKQDQLDRLHWLTWSLGALAPDERLCAFLALSSTFMPFHPMPDGTGVLTVVLSRRDIADYLGTSIETISRIVHRLSETGLIEIIGPSQFRLLDVAGLVGLGQIEGIFDGMTKGFATRRARVEGMITPSAQEGICYCGKPSGRLTRVNEAPARPGIHSFVRNHSTGGFEIVREDD